MKQTEVAPERKCHRQKKAKKDKADTFSVFICFNSASRVCIVVGKLVKFPAIYTNIQDRTQKSINLFFNRFSQHIVEHYNYIAAFLADPPWTF